MNKCIQMYIYLACDHKYWEYDANYGVDLRGLTRKTKWLTLRKVPSPIIQ